jgi:hypothetical protein
MSLAGGSHYKDLSPEPINVIKGWLSCEEYEGYLRGNVVKYIGRYKLKGGVADLRKAKDYLEEMINHVGDQGDSAREIPSETVPGS